MTTVEVVVYAYVTMAINLYSEKHCSGHPSAYSLGMENRNRFFETPVFWIRSKPETGFSLEKPTENRKPVFSQKPPSTFFF